jgi:hypothetical protein
MPSSKGYQRDYAREYAGQKARGESGTGSDSGNAKRKRLRRAVLKRRTVPPGKEVDHVRPLAKGGGNGVENARVVEKKTNRSFPRTKSAGMK